MTVPAIPRVHLNKGEKMKKLILLTLVIFMISSTAHAECKGITFKGKSGTSYCMSKHLMNWYSASAWCQAQGMNLIDVQKVCGSLASCTELNLSSAEKEKITSAGGNIVWGWTNTSQSSSYVYLVNMSTGGTTGTLRANTPLKPSTICQ